eukprot:8510092-Lingulodinium_polyedra.AAC.1
MLVLVAGCESAKRGAAAARPRPANSGPPTGLPGGSAARARARRPSQGRFLWTGRRLESLSISKATERGYPV